MKTLWDIFQLSFRSGRIQEEVMKQPERDHEDAVRLSDLYLIEVYVEDLIDRKLAELENKR